MKKFFLILSVLCTTSLYAQRMTVVDITNIMQYVNDDSLTYQVAVSESFANSERGQELLSRVKKCELCAAKNIGIRISHSNIHFMATQPQTIFWYWKKRGHNMDCSTIRVCYPFSGK